MGLTSRERVMAAFAHEEPDRVPAWCGSSVEFWNKAKSALELDDEGLRVRFGDDFRRVFAVDAGPETPLEHPEAVYRTVFGIERMGLGYGQPVSHPLAGADLGASHDYPWPDPARMDVSNVKADAEVYGGEYAVLGGDWSPFWHDAIDLLGMENLYMKMYDEPELVDALIQHLVDYYAAVSQRIFHAAADVLDVFFIGNDFGSQTGPLLIDLGHAYDLKVQLHCCGGFAELIPAMVGAGLDGLHAVQPNCRGMDLRALKAEFGDKILFNGGIDSHHVVIDGTPDSVRESTREVLDIMMPGGGYVAGASHDTILEETPLENVLAMFETVREYGNY